MCDTRMRTRVCFLRKEEKEGKNLARCMGILGGFFVEGFFVPNHTRQEAATARSS